MQWHQVLFFSCLNGQWYQICLIVFKIRQIWVDLSKLYQIGPHLVTLNRMGLVLLVQLFCVAQLNCISDGGDWVFLSLGMPNILQCLYFNAVSTGFSPSRFRSEYRFYSKNTEVIKFIESLFGVLVSSQYSASFVCVFKAEKSCCAWFHYEIPLCVISLRKTNSYKVISISHIVSYQHYHASFSISCHN